jgi:hypothetical protein
MYHLVLKDFVANSGFLVCRYITPERARTSNLRFRRPTHETDNSSESKDLQQDESCAYKPAYKDNSKTPENQVDSLPPDLTEIITVWADLPEHIKATIKTLVSVAVKENDGVA